MSNNQDKESKQVRYSANVIMGAMTGFSYILNRLPELLAVGRSALAAEFNELQEHNASPELRRKYLAGKSYDRLVGSDCAAMAFFGSAMESTRIALGDPANAERNVYQEREEFGSKFACVCKGIITPEGEVIR